MVKKIFLILKINYNREEIKILNKIIEEFDIKEAKKVKEIENITKHDVKAVEYYLDEKFKGKSEKNAEVPMLSHTHGQNATPTTIGKEIAV